MRLLMVHPGASFSTADVYNGYLGALTRQGHTIHEYRLDERLEVAARHLRTLWRYTKREGKPSSADVIWEACQQIVTRALYYHVDAVLIVSTMYLHPDFLVLLRRAHIPSIVIGTEHPYDDAAFARLLPYIDVAFVNERSSVAALRVVNEDVYYLPHAYDPDTHRPGAQPGDEEVAAHDVVFVGTLFQERIDLLSGVDWTGIDLGLYGAVDLLPKRHPLRRFVRGGIIDNRKAAALYRRAKIGLNLYRTSQGFGEDVPHIAHAESLNPRAVELAACGCFHISNDRAEVQEVFGDAVQTFSDSVSLESSIRGFLISEHNRVLMARRLPYRVEHLTFDRQAAYMVSTLRAAWSGASAAIGA